MTCRVLAFCLTLAVPTAARAAPGLPKRIKSLGQRSYQVQVVKGRAYLATTVGLRIVSLRPVTQPRHLGFLAVPDSLSGLVVAGNTAYLAAGPHGVVIADVSRPKNPKRLSRIDTPGSANQVAVDKNRLYVADGSFGVAVYDITRPRRPRHLKTVSLKGYARDVTVLGRWVFVAAGRQGLVVFPAVPTGRRKVPRRWPGPLYKLPLAGVARDLAVGPGRTLYVAAGPAGFHVLDVRRPRRPRHVATAKVPDAAHGVSAWGSRTAVASGEGGVLLYNCARRRAPRRIASYGSQPRRSANKVQLRRGLIFVAYDHAGLRVLRVVGNKLKLQSLFPPQKGAK